MTAERNNNNNRDKGVRNHIATTIVDGILGSPIVNSDPKEQAEPFWVRILDPPIVAQFAPSDALLVEVFVNGPENNFQHGIG